MAAGEIVVRMALSDTPPAWARDLLEKLTAIETRMTALEGRTLTAVPSARVSNGGPASRALPPGATWWRSPEVRAEAPAASTHRESFVEQRQQAGYANADSFVPPTRASDDLAQAYAATTAAIQAEAEQAIGFDRRTKERPIR